jgi:hypothetical protein
MDKSPRPIGITDMQTGMTTYGMDFGNTIPVWCRPNADHAAAADYLRDAQKRMESWLADTGVPAASDYALQRYLPHNLDKPAFN